METVTGKVVDTERAGTSSMGNPSYWVTLDNGKDYRTSSNASVAYEITNKEFRDTAHTFALTRAGRISHVVTN